MINNNFKRKLANLFKPGDTISQKVTKSAFWLSAFKVIERGLRFVSTIIVARLLSPSDFGLFGIACLAMNSLRKFSETGISVALIQKKNKTEEFLDTAWTINLLRNISLFCILFFGAPLIAHFFNNLSVAPLVRIVGLTMLVTGFTNIGTIYFTKEIDFRKQCILEAIGTLTSLFITITLAFILRNAWALVWGMLGGNIASAVSSYFFHPYRPKLHFKLSQAKELLNFGKWVFCSSILLFLITQGDDILVGKVLGLTALGLYQMAYTISNLPATEVTHVISQITFPAYSKLQDNIVKIKEAYFMILETVNFINIPLTVLIIYLGYDFVRIFLGDKWLPMVISLKILALSGLIRSIVASGGSLFLGVGKPRSDFEMNIYRFLTMIIFIYPLTKAFGIDGASSVVVLSIIATIPSWFMNTKKISNAHYSDYFKAFIPSFLSAVFMFIFIISAKQVIVDMDVLEFVLIVVSSISIYFGSAFLFWKIFKYGPIGSIRMLKH